MSVGVGGGTAAMEQLTEEKRALEERQAQIIEYQKTEAELNEVRDRIAQMERDRAKIRQDAENSKDKEEIRKSLRDQQKIEKLIEEEMLKRVDLEEKLQNLSVDFPETSKIDKRQVLRNIRTLMKIKNVKVGQVEKEAGCSTGYMSRLERDGNTTSPTLEFVATAAEMLGVNMDLIVRGNIEEVSSTDMYMLEFLTELLVQTDSGAVLWQQEDPEQADEKFRSLFFTGTVALYEDSPVVTALIPGGDSRICIVPMVGDFEEGPTQLFSEVSLMAPDGKRTALYNTYASNRALEELTGNLYKSAQEATRNIQLADTAKSVIDQFMATRKRGEG